MTDARADRAVVFDIGNVLVQWDLRALYRNVFADAAEMDRFLTEVWTADHNLRCDAGETFATVTAEVIAEHPEYAVEIRAAEERWIDTLTGPVPGMFELLAELDDAGVPTYGLTNFSAETFPLTLAAYPQLARLRHIVVSGEVGVTKPERRIFDVLCERTGIRPESSVFVDDSPLNTAAAESLGFIAITFTGEPALRRDLTSLGLLPGSAR